jgi:hypothetical protein
MTPADGSPSRACSLPRLRSVRSTGPGRTPRTAAPSPGSANTGRRRITARYDGTLTSASPSTGKDSSSLTGPVNRPAPADPDTSPPASRPIEAQLRAEMARGARHDPGPDDVIGDRASPAPRLASSPCSSPKSSFSRQAPGAGAGLQDLRPSLIVPRSCDPRRRERTPDTAVTPGVALTARAYGNTYPSPRPRISAQIRSLCSKTADQRPECAPDRRVCHK